MQLRRVDVAGLPRARDDLAAFDLIAALDQELFGMSVSGDVAIGMAHENQVAVALELVAGIGHDPVFGGFHRRVLRHRDVDAVVLLAVGRGAIAGDHAAIGRPAKLGYRTASVRELRRLLVERIRRRDDARALHRLRLLGRRRGSDRLRLRGGCRRARLQRGCLRAGNDQAVADVEGRGRLEVVGLGDLVHRLVVAMRDFVERVAGGDDMNAGIARGIHGRGRHRRGSGGPRRGRGCNPRRSVARNDQSLAGVKRCRRRDVIGLHDDGGRHAVAPCDRLDTVAGRDRDRGATVPAPIGRWFAHHRSR